MKSVFLILVNVIAIWSFSIDSTLQVTYISNQYRSISLYEGTSTLKGKFDTHFDMKKGVVIKTNRIDTLKTKEQLLTPFGHVPHRPCDSNSQNNFLVLSGNGYCNEFETHFFHNGTKHSLFHYSYNDGFIGGRQAFQLDILWSPELGTIIYKNNMFSNSFTLIDVQDPDKKELLSTILRKYYKINNSLSSVQLSPNYYSDPTIKSLLYDFNIDQKQDVFDELISLMRVDPISNLTMEVIKHTEKGQIITVQLKISNPTTQNFMIPAHRARIRSANGQHWLDSTNSKPIYNGLGRGWTEVEDSIKILADNSAILKYRFSLESLRPQYKDHQIVQIKLYNFVVQPQYKISDVLLAKKQGISEEYFALFNQEIILNEVIIDLTNP